MRDPYRLLATRKTYGQCHGGVFQQQATKECLNEKWFISPEDTGAKSRPGAYTITRSFPRSVLGWMTPSEFAAKSVGYQNMQPD